MVITAVPSHTGFTTAVPYEYVGAALLVSSWKTEPVAVSSSITLFDDPSAAVLRTLHLNPDSSPSIPPFKEILIV